ncbi:MAG: twin-arginine translocase subunit TatC [Synergistaceae bacterium]|nr:twin-arginine translocase subunit TatC [Synergistaceae bacterium]
MPAVDEKNNFWSHIEELRKRIIFLIVLFVSAAVVFFFFMDEMIRLLQKPMAEHGINLYYREPPEKFFTYCKTSLSCSMFLLIPAAGFQIYSFIIPALIGKERKLFSSLVLTGISLFYAGVLFAWFIMIPFVINFFINFASGDGILPLWGISDYIGMILMFMIVTGICFELPIFLFALLYSGILSIKTMEMLRRYFIVAFFIVAAIVTPPDIFTQIVVGLILCALFEATLIIAKILRRETDGQA